jgi:hypothetical protein
MRVVARVLAEPGDEAACECRPIIVQLTESLAATIR